MNSQSLRVTLYSLVQITAASLFWYVRSVDREWGNVQQFFGHLGPAAFLVAAGAVTLFYRNSLVALTWREAWLATVGGAAYILGDTFVMHAPFGVFDGAGVAEQQHVSIMFVIFVLGISLFVLLRKPDLVIPTSAYFVVGVAVVILIFSQHPQHSAAGGTAHMATLILLGLAALFRMLGKMVEYAILMIVTGFVFFSAQMGFAMYADMAGRDGGAWVAMWAAFGLASATGYLAMVRPAASDGD
jgi:hypothetical protein